MERRNYFSASWRPKGYKQAFYLKKKKQGAGKYGMRKITKSITALILACSLALVPAMSSQAVGKSIATGIDVSKHNGAINWGSVASSGISYAFIKAGSTYSGIDPYFDANMRDAQAAGIKTGVYLYSYANSVEEAANEANLLVGWLSNYTVNYPVVYDVENSNHKNLSNEQLQAMVNTFCSIVSAAGYYPMVYSYRNFFLTKLGGVGYDKWVADYSGSCQYNNNTCFWQSSSHGSIAGVPTRVDINYQYKDYSSLIIPDGFLQRGEFTYFFAGYKMQRGWVAFNDTKYYLDEAGHLQKGGWLNLDTGCYYLTPADGQIARGQYAVDGANYYFNADGVKQTGWVTVADKQFYYDGANEGKQVKGWLALDTGKYYLAADDGHMLTGENDLGGSIYNFGGNGVMLTGWITREDGVKFYYDPATGAKAFGWLADTAGTRYLAADDGHMVTGVAAIADAEYYFDANGIMLTGWQTRDNNRYLYGVDGKLQRGWYADTTGSYYLNPETGAATVGVVTLDKANYCFDATGKMQTGLVKAAEADYYYNPADGKLMTGWITTAEGQVMYANAAGQLVKGLAEIDKATYYFDEKGIKQVNKTVTVDKVPYVLDANGAVVVQPVDPAAVAATPAAK